MEKNGRATKNTNGEREKKDPMKQQKQNDRDGLTQGKSFTSRSYGETITDKSLGHHDNKKRNRTGGQSEALTFYQQGNQKTTTRTKKPQKTTGL